MCSFANHRKHMSMEILNFPLKCNAIFRQTCHSREKAHWKENCMTNASWSWHRDMTQGQLKVSSKFVNHFGSFIILFLILPYPSWFTHSHAPETFIPVLVSGIVWFVCRLILRKSLVCLHIRVSTNNSQIRIHRLLFSLMSIQLLCVCTPGLQEVLHCPWEISSHLTARSSAFCVRDHNKNSLWRLHRQLTWLQGTMSRLPDLKQTYLTMRNDKRHNCWQFVSASVSSDGTETRNWRRDEQRNEQRDEKGCLVQER